MSGFLSALGWSNEPDPLDEVAIVVDGQQITGWSAISITRSAELFPNSFTLTAADQYPYSADQATTFPGGPGQMCRVYIGSDLVVTGYVDRYGVQVAPGQHQVTITGRGLCEDLVDCSADIAGAINGATITAANALDLAKKLSAPFKVSARSAVSDLGMPLPPFTVALGETSYEIIERVARYAGFLVYEDEQGRVVLDRVGTQKMASGFKMPGNIEAAASTLSIDQRYSDYTVVWTTINQYQDLGPLANNRAHVTDPTMPRYRPRIIVSEQTDPAYDIGKARAEWELARRIGRSQAISLTCDSWRDSEGTLWTPNFLAPIDAAALKITDAEWIIGTVTFRKDSSGTHADLILMPPDAFKPQPQPLYLWDRELMTATNQPQSPAPPTTDGSPAGSGMLGRV